MFTFLVNMIFLKIASPRGRPTRRSRKLIHGEPDIGTENEPGFRAWPFMPLMLMIGKKLQGRDRMNMSLKGSERRMLARLPWKN